MRFSGLTTIVVAMFCATGALAQTVYRCDIKDVGGQRGGFIQTPVFLLLEDSQKSAFVFDAATSTFNNKKALKARVRPAANGNLRLQWAINNWRVSDGSIARVRYSGLFKPATGDINFALRIENAENDERGKGKCKALPKGAAATFPK